MKRAAIIDRFATNARCGSPYSSQVSSSVLRIVHISTYTSLAPKKWYMPPSALLVRPPQFTSTWLSQQQKSSSQIAPGQPQLLKRTSLSELHIANGATMVPFAGYLMPVQYNDLSVGQSHQWTREKASLFDVGHMYACAFALWLSSIFPTSALQNSVTMYRSSISVMVLLLIHRTLGFNIESAALARYHSWRK